MTKIIVVENGKEMNFGEYANEMTARILAQHWANEDINVKIENEELR